jgi:hypothetical protein
MEPPRYEVKMSCDAVLLHQVGAWIRMHPEGFVVAYPSRQVNSLYFDSLEAGCLNDNLLGASERAKLRLRWYGQDHTRVTGHFELKSKVNQLGSKRRFPIDVTFDLSAISWQVLLHRIQEAASDDLALWVTTLRQPTLLTSYWREYYESADRMIRVTLDSDLAAYEQFTFLSPNLVHRAPTPGEIIVEVKADWKMHRRLSNVLSSLPLQVSRYSKYVSGVLDSLCFA